MGMVVDGVSDVTNLTAEQVRPAPVSADYLTGLGTLDERMLILIDIVALMSSTELLGFEDRLAE